MSRIKLSAAVLLVLAASRSMAQEHQHGTDEKLGAVHFATSCNDVAQKDFNRAVALLHSFQFSRVIEGFNAVLEEDSTCAIAYWGIALSDWSNPFAPGLKDKGQLQLGRESIERGRKVGEKTERELAYFAAVGKLYADFEGSSQQARLGWARQVEIQELAVAAWSALAAGKKDKALGLMESAAELEDGTEKSAVTPGPLSPARELLGEMLL